MASFRALVGHKKRNPIVNDPANFADDGADDEATFVPTPKTDNEKAALVEALMQNFVFSGLSEKNVLQVVRRMKRVSAVKGEEIIRQGDEGDEFYVLHKGAAEILVNGEQVGKYAAGSSFGELALLYSAKRAATIRATEACVLWSIDIKSFHRLTIRTEHTETQKKLGFLKKVPLLEGLTQEQLARIGDALLHVTFEKGTQIITEGERGDEFYMIESGAVKCTHDKPDGGEQVLLRLKDGDYFGEMALMLDEPRHANVIAEQNVTCYHVSRHNFVRLFGNLQQMLQQQMRIRILKSVPLLSHLAEDILDRLADAMRIQVFRSGKYVVKQGEKGSRFYIINDGSARVTKDVLDKKSGAKVGEEDVGTLALQTFFGERALINNEPRAANVIATEQLECLVLDRDTFKKYLANADAVQRQLAEPGSNVIVPLRSSREEKPPPPPPPAPMGLEDMSGLMHFLNGDSAPAPRELQRFSTLGTGTFGRVSLVVHNDKGEEKVYALKAMQKEQIVASHQERNIMNEKNLLIKCRHRFVLGLVATYQDLDSIYMLMEIVQGGELWSLIYEKQRETAHCRSKTTSGFNEPTSMFYAACVTEAFAHIHSHSVAYRDLKPENLLIDDQGYLKIIDFGFAKMIPCYDPKTKDLHDKTYTICGTPEYLAPEIIQSKGHDKAVDNWALGCLVYELMVGKTPFVDDQQQQIFRKILAPTKILGRASSWPQGCNSPAFKDIVCSLLHSSPAFRLGGGQQGSQGIKGHEWFTQANFDWPSLVSTKTKAPYIPKIRSQRDTSNFDPYEEDDAVSPFVGKQEIFADWSAMIDPKASFPPRRT